MWNSGNLAKRQREELIAELKESELQWLRKDRKGRRGGGIGFLVRKDLQAKIAKQSKSEGLLWLEVQEQFFVVVVYLIPNDRSGVNEDTLQELQEDIIQYKERGEVVVMGDFNCRIGEQSNYMITSDSEVLEIARCSEDKVETAQGRTLLEKLNVIDLVVMNGVRERARFTSYQVAGNSVIDLMWVEHKRVQDVLALTVWNEDFEVLGDHRIVTMDFSQLNLDLQCRAAGLRVREENTRRTEDKEKRPLSWKKRVKEDDWKRFREILCRELTERKEHSEKKEMRQKGQVEIENIWRDWLRIVEAAAEGSIGRQKRQKGRLKVSEWDGELAKLVQEQNRSRKIRDKSEGERRKIAHVEYQKKRTTVKRYIRKKERLMKRKQNEELEALKKGDAKTYWTKLKSYLGLGKSGQELPNELKIEEKIVSGEAAKNAWKEAFQQLGEVNEDDVNFDDQFIKDCKEQIDSWLKERKAARGDLDRPIERAEVERAVKKMKSGKASGVDGIVSEILKRGGEGMLELTWKLCSEVFEAERVPRDWTRGLIFPLFKGGEKLSTDNYRGICLLSIIGKLYASILNQRLLQWCEKRRKFGEEQAGFRPGRTTMDHAFVLSELVRSRKSSGLDSHICFLDIRKAYDTVSRESLWKRLLDIGVDGKMWRVIRNMYEVVESTVIVGEELTDWFSVQLGVKQGCTLSPLLFLIFVESLSQKLRKCSVGLKAGHVSINHLLFADDLALRAGSQQEMQQLLDIVYDHSWKWRFRFNISKSNVLLVAGKKKHVLTGNYYLGLEQLKIVKAYKYLGLEFEDTLRWDMTQRKLTAKAQSKAALLSKAVSEGLS